MGKFIDLTGTRFERLLVIRRGEDHIQPSGLHQTVWLCVCDCGNKVFVQAQSLKSGHSKSCGCLKIEKGGSNFIDITGKKFGMLTVIKRTDNYIRKNGKILVMWSCECECGNIISTTSVKLKSNIIVSCGCSYESLIASELKRYCIKNYGADKKENREFINPKTNNPLPFDIYIPKNKVFIEINGKQHYVISFFHKLTARRNGTTPEEEFEYQKKKDRMKRKYARENGIYIEIDLRKIKTTDQAIRYIEKILFI